MRFLLAALLSLASFAHASHTDYSLKRVKYTCDGELKVKIGGQPVGPGKFEIIVDGLQRLDFEVENGLFTLDPKTYNKAEYKIGAENLFLALDSYWPRFTLEIGQDRFRPYNFFVAQLDEYIRTEVFYEGYTPVAYQFSPALKGGLHGNAATEYVYLHLTRISDGKTLECTIKGKKGHGT